MLSINANFVLIVEDDLYSIEVLSSLLDIENIQHSSVQNGSQILQIMDESPNVDIIFLDLELDDPNGFEVLKMIRSDAKWDRIPVVAYTSHTSEKSHAREVGFHSFLGKPLSGQEFPNQLRSILNNQPVWE